MTALNDKKAAWIGRTKEIADYEGEKRIHNAVIASLPVDLPAEWPENLAAYRNAKRGELVGAALTDEEYAQVIDMQLRDKSRGAIREVNYELNKCNRYLAAIEAELPLEDRGKPLTKMATGLAHLEALRINGEILSYQVDEDTLKDFGTVGTAAVVIERLDATKKRRIVIVDDDGDVVLVHSSKPTAAV